MDARARVIAVSPPDGMAPAVELEVSRKAKVYVDGAEASLDDLHVGQGATITYEAGLGVATSIQATGAGEVAPEVVNLAEVNTKKRDFCPWLSPDGLTIYWVTDTPADPEGEIWSARRKDPGSLFAGKRLVAYGRHMAVSVDGLTMYLVTRRADGRPGNSIHVARRSSNDEAFGRPREVPELRAVNTPRNLSLSQDGRTLLFNEGSEKDDTFRLSVTTRRSLQSRWESLKSLPVNMRRSDGLVLCPFLTRDGLRLFCSLSRPGIEPRGRFMVLSRRAANQPFAEPVFLQVPDVEEFVGWLPRYVEATGELFFCSERLSTDRNMDIWMVRHFKP